MDDRGKCQYQFFFMKKALVIGCQLFAMGAIAQVKDSVKTVVPKDTSVHAPVVIAFVPAKPYPDTSLHIYSPAIVTGTEDKIYQYQRNNHGTSPGYRVQIDFGQEKNAVEKIQADFLAQYPGVTSYIAYKQPYFKLSVGDFRSRLQAVDFLNKVRKDYKAAFVVSDRIVPPPVQ
jgi:SPOR domain